MSREPIDIQEHTVAIIRALGLEPKNVLGMTINPTNVTVTITDGTIVDEHINRKTLRFEVRA